MNSPESLWPNARLNSPARSSTLSWERQKKERERCGREKGGGSYAESGWLGGNDVSVDYVGKEDRMWD